MSLAHSGLSPVARAKAASDLITARAAAPLVSEYGESPRLQCPQVGEADRRLDVPQAVPPGLGQSSALGRVPEQRCLVRHTRQHVRAERYVSGLLGKPQRLD